MAPDPAMGVAVVTGASSGIGAVYADRLARRGYDLMLVARNLHRLSELAARLEAENGTSVRVMAADLADEADLRRVEDAIRADHRMTMLVNNAGIGAVAPLLASDVDRMEAMIDLNVTALTRLTYAAAPGFVARRHGTFINVSSVAALSETVLNGVYCASKAYVLMFSRSLHHELAKSGVRVHAILPGATRTEFWNVAGRPVEDLPAERVMGTEEMVDAAMAGLDAGEVVTIPALPSMDDWEDFERARMKLVPNLSRSKPAARFAAAPAPGTGATDARADPVPSGPDHGSHETGRTDAPNIARTQR